MHRISYPAYLQFEVTFSKEHAVISKRIWFLRFTCNHHVSKHVDNCMQHDTLACLFMHAYTNDFKFQVLLVRKERCYTSNTPRTTGHNSQMLQTFVIILHTIGLSNYYHMQPSTTTAFYGYQLTNRTERRATNNNR